MIENRQKTPSGPQGVLLGVPKDPQTTQMAIQDAKMWLPKLTNIKLWCQKGGKPESRRVKDWGPAAEGEALKIIIKMGTTMWSTYRQTRGNSQNYPPRGPAAARPAPGVGNSLIFHMFFLYFDPILVPIFKTI